MRRRFTLFAGLLFVLIACAAVIVMFIAQSNSDRASFLAFSQDRITAFNEQYDLAFQQGEPWTVEPRDIALRFYACGDECGGESITDEISGPGKAVVFLEDHRILDDSIKAIKQRIEITIKGTSWTVEWAGWKQQCRRDDWTAFFQGRFGWHTQLCP